MPLFLSEKAGNKRLLHDNIIQFMTELELNLAFLGL